jgi:hypothetical protein
VESPNLSNVDYGNGMVYVIGDLANPCDISNPLRRVYETAGGVTFGYLSGQEVIDTTEWRAPSC